MDKNGGTPPCRVFLRKSLAVPGDELNTVRSMKSPTDLLVLSKLGILGVGFLKNLRDTPQKDLRFLCSTIHGQKITRPSNMQQPSNIYQQPSKNSRFFPVRTSKPQSFGRAQLRHFFCYSSMCVAGLVASFNGSFIAKKLCPPTTNPNSNDNNDI